MDHEQRKAAFRKARAEAYEKSLAQHSVKPAPVSQTRTPSDSEMLRLESWIDERIVTAVAGYHASKEMRPITREVLRGLVAEIRAEVSAEVTKLRDDCKLLDKLHEATAKLERGLDGDRGAKAHPPEANEFFYLDENGKKQDADLHGPILRAVDFPIDEKIMAPIRERNRAKWQAEQKAKSAEARAARAARVVDLLPLRGSHRG